LSEEEYKKIKALKEEYNVSWADLIAYSNQVISGGMKNDNTKK